MAEGVRIGVDVGGTFTDLVAWDPAGRMESCKVPTTPANPAEGVLHGIAIFLGADGNLKSGAFPGEPALRVDQLKQKNCRARR